MKNIQEINEFKDFGKLELIAKQVVEGFITGLHKSPFHGFSVEFAEHRIYNKGESTKNIDWKLYAKTDKLFVKKYEEETNLRSQIIIDVSSSMLFPYKDKHKQSKLTFSIYSAAALIYLLRKQRDAAGLTFFSDKINLHTEAKMSGMHSRYLFGELSKLLSGFNELNVSTESATALHETADKIHKRSLIIIFSDMFSSENPENVFSALRHLKHNKHEVILFHVIDKNLEFNFEYSNRPVKFIDLETGENIKLNPNEIRENFTKSANTFLSELKLKCAQYKIDFISADINEDFKEILIPYLIKRRKLN
jgi:uncharacterized protein (DUF58 family)